MIWETILGVGSTQQEVLHCLRVEYVTGPSYPLLNIIESGQIGSDYTIKKLIEKYLNRIIHLWSVLSDKISRGG